MKRRVVFALLLLMLTGCGKAENHMNTAIHLREQMNENKSCSFEAEITADYVETTQSFTLSCETDDHGQVRFTVESPEMLQGIAGILEEDGGKLTFDNEAVQFETLADGRLAPICAPWVLVHTLRSGYITACGEEKDGLRLSIDDSYRTDALSLDIWLGEEDLPVAADISYQGRRILSMVIRNFRFL